MDFCGKKENKLDKDRKPRKAAPGVFEYGDFSIDAGKLLPQDPQCPS
jgi:hypothetical protein